MSWYRKTFLLTFAGLSALALCLPAAAQQATDIAEQSADLTSPEETGGASAPEQATAAQATSGSPLLASSDTDLTDNKWHYYATGYLWIPGIHGTVGVRGFDTNVHVTAGEIFSNFSGGLLGAFIPTYNRFSVPIDYMWMRLKDDKAIPYNPAYSVQALLNFSVVTPKVAYMVVKNPKIKIYGTAGARIWHLGATLDLVPPINGGNLYKGLTWADIVVGARFSLPLGAKASLDVTGDYGEGGAKTDYQVAGLLNYQLKPKLSLQGGWRYLAVNYDKSGAVLDTSIQGIVLGATFKLK